MYTEINLRLEEAQQGIFHLRKIDSMVEELIGQQLPMEVKVCELKAIVDKENLDVEKLEKKSLASIFYSVLGSLDQHVDKEYNEALAAKLKYDQAVRDLEDVKHQLSEVQSERVKYEGSIEKYEKLYTQKKELLMKSSEQTAQLILDLSEQISLSKNNLKEIKEAISAGREVVNCLDNALNSLDSAEGWGVWDMFGGGLISDIAKHSNIDDAKCEVERTQTLLRRFKTELSDIKMNENICIETDGFAKFADFFFDGLIADWFMQSKIHNSQESVANVKNQVKRVISKLNFLESENNLNINKLQNKINDFISMA